MPDIEGADPRGELCIAEVFPGVLLADATSVRAAALAGRPPFDAALCVHSDDGDDGWADSVDEFLQVPLVDGDLCPPPSFRRAALALRGFIARRRRTVVYCHAGVSRSASVIAACTACYTPEVLDECVAARAALPLPRDFDYYHAWLRDEAECAAVGFAPEFLRETAFRRCLLAFEAMAKVAPQVFMSPHLWYAVYPEVRAMFAPSQ